MTKSIIFDLDGTLIDSCAICVDILNAMLVDRGQTHRIDPDHARSFMSQGGETMVAGLLGKHCADPTADLAEFRARYHTITTPITALFDGVAQGLRQLKHNGYILAICSNKPQGLCEKVLNDTGIADMFSVIVGGAPAFAPKPAADLLDRTLALLQLNPADCLYVGDSELDHQVAARADIPFYFMTYGYAEAGCSTEDAHHFDHFTPLVDALIHQRAMIAA